MGVTMGDPAGIGPEICLRLLADRAVREACRPVLLGDANVLRAVAAATGLRPPGQGIRLGNWAVGAALHNGVELIDFSNCDLSEFAPGKVNATTGAAAYAFVTAAIDACIDGRLDAMVTAPIHKEALHAAGVTFPGHTEILAARTNTERVCMMLTAEAITCSLVTTHIGIKDVPRAISFEAILSTIELTDAAMRKMRGLDRPARLAVLGLNPHAGEGGLFGDHEEERIIAPAIAIARSRGFDVEGPLPPDTAFLPTRLKRTDAHICMYHDQGLIPLKMLAFDQAVNITLGLPIVRTSVDHGTALDIAWRATASASSLLEAVRLAASLAAGR